MMAGTGPKNEPPDLVLLLQPAGALLVERRSQFFLRLSSKAVELALQLARTGLDLDRVQVLQSRQDSSSSPTRAELDNLLRSHPVTKSWLEGVLPTPLRIVGSTRSFVPLMCSLQLTNLCNLKCSFCYASSGSKYPEELTSDQWIDVILDLAAAGVCGVTFTGGEPTLVRGFPKLLAAAGSCFTTVDVITNGMHWPDNLLQLAAALGNVRCQVSIDGNSEHHDALRRVRGSYDRALASIRAMRSYKLPVVVAMTVSPLNYQDVESLISVVADLGVEEFRAGQVSAVGRGVDEDFNLTENQKEHVRAQLTRAQRDARIQVPQWGAYDDLAARAAAAVDADPEYSTPGYLHWYVRADGIVTLCQIDDSALGHILHDSLHAIGSPDRFADLPRDSMRCHCFASSPPVVRKRAAFDAAVV